MMVVTTLTMKKQFLSHRMVPGFIYPKRCMCCCLWEKCIYKIFLPTKKCFLIPVLFCIMLFCCKYHTFHLSHIDCIKLSYPVLFCIMLFCCKYHTFHLSHIDCIKLSYPVLFCIMLFCCKHHTFHFSHIDCIKLSYPVLFCICCSAVSIIHFIYHTATV